MLGDDDAIAWALYIVVFGRVLYRKGHNELNFVTDCDRNDIEQRIALWNLFIGERIQEEVKIGVINFYPASPEVGGVEEGRAMRGRGDCESLIHDI
jgi:hypothetical protein